LRGLPRRELLAALSGVLLALSFPKFGRGFVAWIAIAPLLISLHGVSGARAFRLGYVTGAVSSLGLLYWTSSVVVAYGGPLSYVFERRDDAVVSCRRVLRPGGLLLASVMSLWGTLHRHLAALRDYPLANMASIVVSGDLTTENDPTSPHHCHMYQSQELVALLQRHGFTIAALAASNALSTNLEPLLLELRQMDDRWQALLDLERQATAQPGYVDGGTHLIVAARGEHQ